MWGDPIHMICLVVDKSRNAVAFKLGGAFTEKAAPQKEPIIASTPPDHAQPQACVGRTIEILDPRR